MMLPLAITGMSSVSGLGQGTAAFEQALFSGGTVIGPVAFDRGSARARLAAAPADFDPAAYIAPARRRRIDRIGQLAVASCHLLLQEAGIDDDAVAGAFDRKRIGVALGSTTAGLHTLVRYMDGLVARGRDGASALDFSNTVGNAAASLCGIELGLRGANVTLNYKEASSAAAIAYAATVLHGGQADAVITGGVEEIEETYFAVHDAFGALAHDDAHGQEGSRPFDRRRNGFVLGSGAFTVLLETDASARRRSARIHGHVVGVAAGAGPCGMNQWPTDATPLARCMREALAAAGATPADVGAVFASANSTPVLDRTEAEAITSLFGPLGVPVVSVKGALGESGASAAASLQAALIALGRRRLPPTVGLAETDPACPVDVSAEPRDLPAGRGGLAVVNSFASGGANYCLVARV